MLSMEEDSEFKEHLGEAIRSVPVVQGQKCFVETDFKRQFKVTTNLPFTFPLILANKGESLKGNL